MRLDRFLTLWLFRPLRSLGLRSAGARLPVLMYHSISDDPEPAFSPYYKICTSPKRFAEHMQWLEDAGYRGVTLTEGLDWLNRTQPSVSASPRRSPEAEGGSPLTAHCSPLTAKQPVAITFDDGFRDFATTAFPTLQQHGFSATMYLPTAFIGEERRSFKGRECLTWSEVRQLGEAGIEFGSHTVNHPKLVDCTGLQIEIELRESKEALGRERINETAAFAYPFAFPQENITFVARLDAALRKYGYRHCATTVIGRVKSGDAPFRVRRLPVNSCDDRGLFMAKLAGSYDWLARPQDIVRRWKFRRSLATRTLATASP